MNFITRAQRLGTWTVLAASVLSLSGCIVVSPRPYRHYIVESPRYEPPPPRRYADPYGPRRRDGY